MIRLLWPFLPLPPWDARWDSARKGHWGERAVTRHLWRRGYRPLAHRWVSAGDSDIDLIMGTREMLLFAEVKLRRDGDPEPWAEVHHPDRVARLRGAVGEYLRHTRQTTVTIRIDGYLVIPTFLNPRQPRIEAREGYIAPTAVPGWRGIIPAGAE